MPYLYHTDDDRRAMLDALGLKTVDALFEPIPERYRWRDELPIGPGRSEWETLSHFQEIAGRNHAAGGMVSFLGGGIYDHIVPSALGHIAGRSEFATAYTPYQAEVSQGTLQVIFEYQTLVSRLTAMPVANASMYDGATALAESALMAAKRTGRGRVVCTPGVNPRYTHVLQTYLGGQGLAVTPVAGTAHGDVEAAALERELSDDVAAVLVQTPNYFGVLESPWRFEGAVHEAGALLVVVVDPCSLSIFRPPGEYGADIVVGEGQALGNPMSFGGPLLGFMACSKQLIRSLPGRLVSETRDVDGKRAFTLTLQTREQHIRRERATSNICTNQGLVALRSTIYLSLLGETGFRELGRTCHAKAKRLAGLIAECPGYSLRFAGPFFREFVVRCPAPAADVTARAREAGVLAGIPLSRYFGEEMKNDLLVAVTEKRTEDDFETLCNALRKV